MTLRIHHKIDLGEASSMLRRLDRAGQDMTEVFDNIGESLLRTADQRFTDEIDPDGNPWSPLSPATLKRKRGRKILTESGRLRNLDKIPHKDSVEIGTNLVYARIHQLGGKAGRKKKVAIPARPFLGVSASDQVLIDGIVRDYLRGIF